MSDQTARAIEMVNQAKSDGFKSVQLRTERLAPGDAAEVIRHLPGDGGFDPGAIATHVEKLPDTTGQAVQLSKSATRTVLAVSIPGPASEAFEWANTLQESLSAAGVKMNFGPSKTSDLKVFWGVPDVNTLIDLGGEDD